MYIVSKHLVVTLVENSGSRMKTTEENQIAVEKEKLSLR